MTRRNEWLKRLSSWLEPVIAPIAAGARQSHQATTADEIAASSATKAQSPGPRPVPQDVGPLHDARLRQRVATVFGASQPVQERSGLCGRDRKLAELLDGVRYRRNHAVICGPRGSGKTSLAKIFGDYADEDGAVVLYMAGSDDASFEELLSPYLKQIPEACCAPGAKQQIAEAISRDRLTASVVVDLLSAIRFAQVIFIFDEFDRITSAETKAELTTLMKLTSDACVKVSYVVVGIAENLHELIAEHASLRRHLTIVTVEPLAEEAIGRILSDCFDGCGLSCEEEAIAMLTASSCGSPYHARLFGMHAALNAISARTRRIAPQHVRAGLQAAFREWRAGNPDDAEVFEQLARAGGDESTAIVRLARSAAYRQAGAESSFGLPEGEEGNPLAPPSALRPSLEQRHDGMVFKDSLAPQFLLIAVRMGGVLPANPCMEAVE